MNVFCVQLCYLSTRSALTIALTQQCQAMTRQGKKVYLIYWKNIFSPAPTDQEIYDQYDIKDKFTLIGLPVPNKGPRVAVFSFFVFLFFLLKKRDGIVYTRSIQIASVASFLRINTIIEFHTHYKHTLYQRLKLWPFSKLLRPEYIIKTIVISDVLKHTIAQEKIFNDVKVIPSGANPPATHLSKEFDQTVYNFEIGYTGSLSKAKGIEIILELAKLLTNIRFHIVGGNKKDIQYWSGRVAQSGIRNIVFHGHVNFYTMSTFLNAFDICLLPTSPPRKSSEKYEIEISGYTSPLKLFDYMAHGKAIICADRIEFREILDENMTIFCNPTNTQEWVNAILLLKNDEIIRKRLGDAVLNEFENKYTWDKRSQRVFDFD